jgi:hypothetical protein
MKTVLLIVIGFVLGVVACIAALLLIGALGVVDMGASTRPGALERTLAPWVVDVSRSHRAPHQVDPYTNSAAVYVGLKHYRENCLVCHGAPDLTSSEISMGLNPSAPDLASRRPGSLKTKRRCTEPG